MKLVIADTSSLLSLGHVGQIRLIEKIFDEFYIAGAVWEELNDYDNPEFDKSVLKELKSHLVNIQSKIVFLIPLAKKG